MNNVKRLFLKSNLVLTVGLILGFCISNTALGQAKDKWVQIPSDGVGKICKIEVETKDSSTKRVYEGKITKVTAKFIVLDDVMKTGTKEQRLPYLKNIPYISRLFKNVEIERESVTGKLKLSRKRVIKFEIVKPKKPAAK